MLPKNSIRRALLTLLPLLLMSACATNSPPFSPQSAEPAKIPFLPSEARVSQVPTPSICSPTCTAGVTKLREQSLHMLTNSGSGAQPASASPTDYSLRPANRARGAK